MPGSLSADHSPTASIFHIYSSFSGDIDLTDGSIGPIGVCARAVKVLTTGNLVLKNLKDTSQTFTSPGAGFQIDGSCSKIVASGTTVTAVLVYW